MMVILPRRQRPSRRPRWPRGLPAKEETVGGGEHRPSGQEQREEHPEHRRGEFGEEEVDLLLLGTAAPLCAFIVTIKGVTNGQFLKQSIYETGSYLRARQALFSGVSLIPYTEIIR